MQRWLDELYLNLIRWRKAHFSNTTFTIMLAISVGLLAGLSAVILKAIISTVAESITYFPKFLLFLTPVAGILLVAALKNSFFRDISRYTGIGNILYSIAKTSAYIKPVLMYSRMITAGLTMGFGGSAGLESTLVVTGSAIGSNVSRFFRLQYKYRTLLIACGSAAGIAAIFYAPIAGVIFALEVIIPTFSTTIFIPILIASATGALFSHLFLQGDFIFNVNEITALTITELPVVIVLGIFCGLMSLYFTHLNFWMDRQLNKIDKWYWRALFGGSILGLLIAFFPLFYGEGYLSINQLLNGRVEEMIRGTPLEIWNIPGRYYFIFFLAIVFLKPIASNLTIMSGGDGGNFAPSFITGGYLGYVFYLLMLWLFPELSLSPVNYILIGMAGMLSGVMHAPLMSIFIIAELSGSYALFIPLMIISALSYFIKYHFQKIPIFLSEQGQYHLARRHHESLPLNQLSVAELVETGFEKVPLEATLKEMLPLVGRSHRNIFPIVTEDNELAGILLLDDIRSIMFDPQKHDIKIKNLMHAPPAIIQMGENMSEVMQKFDQTEAWNLPVTRGAKYVGFLSKSRIFSAYRKELFESRMMD